MTPTLEEIKTYFSKAKEIRCLRLGIPVGVCQVKKYAYNEENNSWEAAGVVFWQKGVFAQITKSKCSSAPCEGCLKKRKLKNQ